MDSSMTNVALPSIMRSFGSSLPQTEWVVLTYLLTITVTLLFWGRFADWYGKSTIYLVGMLVFTTGSLACYLATSLGLLCFFRFIQAMGAAMMMATGPAIIKMIFPIEKLGMALGFIGIATSTGLLLGPVISGVLIHNYSWRTIFLVTVPVSLTAFVWGWLRLRPSFQQVEKTGAAYPIDWLGMILWAAIISGVVLLSTLCSQASLSVVLISSFIIVLLVFQFFKVERQHQKPLFPLILFQKRFFSIAIRSEERRVGKEC